MNASSKTAQSGEWIRVSGWDAQDWLWHGFSTRRGGVSRVYLSAEDDAGELNLGYTKADLPENVRENRKRLIEAITGSRETPLFTVSQVHSNLSVILDSERAAGGAGVVGEADGILTNQQGVIIGILTADCIPVLIADPVHRSVGAFHAGWRGTVERIVERGIDRMRAEFGSEPGDLIAAIGPGIGQCCYTVGAEVRERFEEKFSYASELFSLEASQTANGDGNPALSPDLLRLDLIEANRRQLLAAGLQEDSIAVAGSCTSCHPELFYSHRASGGNAGRMMAVIGVR